MIIWSLHEVMHLAMARLSLERIQSIVSETCSESVEKEVQEI